MANPTLAERWIGRAPRLRSLLRIAAADALRGRAPALTVAR